MERQRFGKTKTNGDCMNVKEIRAMTGLTQKAFADKYHIPKRSLENWEQGFSKCPEYVIELLEFKVQYDMKSLDGKS